MSAYPERLDLVSALSERWGVQAEREASVALTWLDTEAPERVERWSYAQLSEEIELSAGFIESLGLKRGDLLGMQAPRSLDWLPTFLGALSRGVSVLLLNDAYTPRELDYTLADAGAKVALIPRASHAELLKLQARRADLTTTALISVERLRAERRAHPPLKRRGDLSGEDLAVLAYTSGTTGRPKGAMIRHRDIIGTLKALYEAWAWSASDVLVHTLPLFHIHGLFVAALGGLWASAHIALLPRFDALEALRGVEQVRATVLMGVPTHHHRYLKIPADQRPDLSSLRLVTSGSAPLSAELFASLNELFGVEVVERYGMTEVGIVLSAPLRGVKRAGSVGDPLPGVSAKICDAQDVELSSGEVGELHISSESLFAGYYGRPEATEAAVYQDETGRRWMRTGDICVRDEDGRHWLRGRASEMIISGGLNVYPREVERALLEVGEELIDEALVLGIPDPEWGERVEAYLTTRSGAPPPAGWIEEITRALRDHLAPYKRPKQVRWISSLPRNAMGKLQRHRLRPQWRSGGCHCGAVRWRAKLPERFDAEACNCSICAMSGNVHVIVPSSVFELERGADQLKSYRYNTQQAEHLFCEVCGVKSFYHPRSHPEGVGVTWRCLDGWGNFEVNEIPFDGQNWEESIARLRGRQRVDASKSGSER